MMSAKDIGRVIYLPNYPEDASLVSRKVVIVPDFSRFRKNKKYFTKEDIEILLSKQVDIYEDIIYSRKGVHHRMIERVPL
jgi:hypothetical protein